MSFSGRATRAPVLVRCGVPGVDSTREPLSTAMQLTVTQVPGRHRSRRLGRQRCAGISAVPVAAGAAHVSGTGSAHRSVPVAEFTAVYTPVLPVSAVVGGRTHFVGRRLVAGSCDLQEEVADGPPDEAADQGADSGIADDGLRGGAGGGPRAVGGERGEDQSPSLSGGTTGRRHHNSRFEDLV